MYDYKIFKMDSLGENTLQLILFYFILFYAKMNLFPVSPISPHLPAQKNGCFTGVLLRRH